MQNQQIWEVVVSYLKHIGTEVVFGIPNDDLGILRGLNDHNLRLILTKDQRNAVFMAAGYALAKKQMGVCAVGKGPALTNAITGLLESASLSAPVLLIGVGTGSDRIGTRAFQEANQMALVKPVVKWAYRVEHPGRLLWALEKAAFLAINGNPGPVYIEIPEDLTEVPAVSPSAFMAPAVLRSMPLINELDAAFAVLTNAQKPLFLIGGGAKNSSLNGVFERLAEHVGAAVFTTASGRGVVDEGHSLFCGLAGLYTAKPMREMWHEADLIVVFGSRMEETATLLMDTAANTRKVIQIDLDIDNFSHMHIARKLWGDCASTATYWADRVNDIDIKTTDWTIYIGELKQLIVKQRKELLDKLALSPQVHVAEILAGIEEAIPANSVIVQENGLLDMWSYFYPYFSFKPGQVSIVPSEQTTLGFGAAAAVGVKLANPDSMVIAFVGDGAFNMFRSDLFTTADNNIPVTYIVLNNHSFGWLEYQLRCQNLTNSPFQFKGDTQVSHPFVVTMEITTKDQLNSVLAKARQHNLEGKTVVMDVLIPDIDVAPGAKDFYGEFKD